MLFFLFLVVAFQASSSAPAPTTGAVSWDGAEIGFSIRGRELRVPGCINPGRYRTKQEIVWSCVATIFACTWVAFHPNVPCPTDSRWKRFKRNVMVLTCALVGPEFVTIWALRQRVGAAIHQTRYNEKHHLTVRDGRPVCEKIKAWIFGPGPSWNGSEGGYIEGEMEDEKHGGKDVVVSTETKNGIPWTLMHGFLLEMGGLVAYTPESQIIITDVDQLSIPVNVPREHIEDRSKRDNLTKVVVIFQTGWFILQCAARWITRLPVTKLEVITLAFAFLNIITYILWLKKPQKMGIAIYMRVQKLQRHTRTTSMFSDKIQHFVKTLLYFKIFAPVIPFVRMLGFKYEKSQEIGTFYSSVVEVRGRTFIIGLSLVSIAFGGIHLIPIWLSIFPSHIERLLWELSSIWITVEPLVLLCLLKPLMEKRGWVFGILSFIAGASGLMCIFSRLALLVLAFFSLRDLQQDVYFSVDWSSFLPHAI